jgi:hypothetical protein
MQQTPSGDEPGQPLEAQETLRRLEERLDRASDAAQRLIAEAAQTAGRAGAGQAKPPPSGWQAPGHAHPEPGRPSELELLLQVLHSLRDLIPPELQQRIAEAVRELLLALRALIDWYVERLDRRRAEPVEVQDIPIQ